MKDKKNLIIIGLLIIIILVGIYVLFFSNKKYDVTFTLNGEENMTLEYGLEYKEPGFIAQDGYGNDISDYVEITGQVNSMQAGNYEITYQLNFEKVNKKLIRNITIERIDINKLNIVLNGDETVYLLKGANYEEQGARVISAFSNEEFDLGTMNITNNIDNEKAGTYIVNYNYTYDEQTITKERKVEVFDIKYTITPNTVTTGKVKIAFDLETMNNYSNTKLPDGKTSLFKKIDYEVDKNGNYNFVITTKSGDTFERNISINNIIASYNCSGTITNSGTKITVSPTSGDVKSYEWVIGGKTTTGKSEYNEYKIIKNAKVNVIFNNGEKYTTDCLIEDKLLYHFSYPSKGVKKEIQCNSYTSADRTKLEKMLKQAINEAGGKGSRGGTVAAARFFVGALNYRVRYQAPRNGDAALGKYQKAGLNIGNNKAWGCMVSGYTNGFDCTNFIEWVLAQTGFTGGAYSYTHVKVTDMLDKIKPGDIFYLEKNSYHHVAMLIGITKDKLYVAESVPASYTTSGVRLSTYNRSELGKTGGLGYNYVGKVPYKSEGVVTDMWLTE